MRRVAVWLHLLRVEHVMRVVRSSVSGERFSKRKMHTKSERCGIKLTHKRISRLLWVLELATPYFRRAHSVLGASMSPSHVAGRPASRRVQAVPNATLSERGS